MKEDTVVNAVMPDYKNEIAGLIRSNLVPKAMCDRLLDYHERDVAESLELLSADERLKLYKKLHTDYLTSVIEYADEPGKYISELSIKKRVDVLSLIEVSVAAQYLDGLEKKERDALIELMADEPKRELRMVASFDDDEIGSKLTTNYISVTNGISVKNAMSELLKQAAENDNVSTIYVVEEDGSFVGAIDLKDLIIARENTPLDSIIMRSYPYVYANEAIDECIERIKDYSEDTFPVLDEDNKLKGVLTAFDVASLITEEIQDDYAKLGGLTEEEGLKEPLKKSIGKRLPWLIVLFGLGLLVSAAAGLFENVVAGLTLIVSFQSLILGMAGNAGTQSLAVTIRLLSNDEITARQKAGLVFKEARVGLCNGLLLGILSFILIGIYLILLKGQNAVFAFSVSFCIGIALIISILLSGISGTAIPILFKRLKIDPAVASGPFITTINDLVAVVTYYGLAWLFLMRLAG